MYPTGQARLTDTDRHYPTRVGNFRFGEPHKSSLVRVWVGPICPAGRKTHQQPRLWRAPRLFSTEIPPKARRALRIGRVFVARRFGIRRASVTVSFNHIFEDQNDQEVAFQGHEQAAIEPSEPIVDGDAASYSSRPRLRSQTTTSMTAA